MPKRSLAAILLAAFVLVLGVVAAGCGDDDDSGSNGSGSSSSQSEEKPAIKVGLVTDIGGLNDRSFNQLANEGLERAKSELGVEGRVLTSKSDADYVPNLSTLAQQKYDLVIGVGFLMSDAMNTVATKFPDTNFAIIDFSQGALKAKPANVRGLLFKENEAGYLDKNFPQLTAEQKEAILKRQYNRMLELGGNIYFTAKLGATDGHSFQHLAAVMTSSTQEDYANMMLRGGRAVDGNRSRSGKYRNAGSSIVKADKTKSKPKASKGKKRRG